MRLVLLLVALAAACSTVQAPVFPGPHPDEYDVELPNGLKLAPDCVDWWHPDGQLDCVQRPA